MAKKCENGQFTQLVRFANLNNCLLSATLQGEVQFSYLTFKKKLSNKEWEILNSHFIAIGSGENRKINATAQFRFLSNIGNDLDVMYMDSIPFNKIDFYEYINSMELFDTTNNLFYPCL